MLSGGDWVEGAIGWGWVRRTGGHCGWSRRGGAAGGVKHLRHLAMVDAVGVVAKGCMGVLVFEGSSLVLVASVTLSVGRGRSGECGVVGVEVPSRRGELVPRWRVVEQVGGMRLVGRSQVGR